MMVVLEHFEHFTPHHGTVEVGGNHFLKYKGKGTCIVHPLLPDGTPTTVKLMNVLYVPSMIKISASQQSDLPSASLVCT